MSRPFLSPKNAEAYLDLKPGSLNQLRFRGDGPPFVRVGQRLIRYKVQDLLAWAESRRVVPAAVAEQKGARR